MMAIIFTFNEDLKLTFMIPSASTLQMKLDMK